MWDAPAPEGHFTYIDLCVDALAYNVTRPAIPAREVPEPVGTVTERGS
jgi:hypothetical protein